MRLHNPVLAYENGSEFLEVWHCAAAGEIDPFLLVVEGSIPNEANKAEGFWAGFGTDPATGQPITTCQWLEWLAPRAWAVVAAGTCSSYGGIHAMAGNPTGCMGLPDFLGWQWRSRAGIPIICIPGCPVLPDNMTETLLYLLSQAVGHGPDDPARRDAAADLAVRPDRSRGLRPRGFYEQAEFATEYRLAQMHCQARVLGAGRAMQRRQARLDGRHRRLRQRGRHLHRMHDAGLPRQVHAVHGRCRRVRTSRRRPCRCMAKPSGACASLPARR